MADRNKTSGNGSQANKSSMKAKTVRRRPEAALSKREAQIRNVLEQASARTVEGVAVITPVLTSGLIVSDASRPECSATVSATSSRKPKKRRAQPNASKAGPPIAAEPSPAQKKAIEAALRKRQAKAAKKARDAALRAAAIREGERIERERKAESERRRMVELDAFIKEVDKQPFSALIANWRRHVELVSYIERSGVNRHRIDLYRHVVAAIEGEWRRRSKLNHSPAEYFDWPHTRAPKGAGAIDAPGWVEQGVLAYLGYHVGVTSNLIADQRWAILKRAFIGQLPPIESPGYMAEWGKPSTPARLKKLANSIASFARQAKRQSSRDMSEAVAAWEADLRWLRDEFYVAKFGFDSPRLARDDS